MGRWFVPLAIFSVGALGALAVSEAGRESLRWMREQLDDAPDQLLTWNEAAQRELDRIEATLNRIAESITPVHADVV
jgi:hypothetical protein